MITKDKYVHTLYGIVVQRFETWLSSDCTIKSQCVSTANGRYSKILVIKVSGCGVGEVCMLHNRKYQCRPSKPLCYLIFRNKIGNILITFRNYIYNYTCNCIIIGRLYIEIRVLVLFIFSEILGF